MSKTCTVFEVMALTILSALEVGCTSALSLHPLSDENTSVIDKRLIGHWRLTNTKNQEDSNLPRFVTGLAKEYENSLEIVFMDVTPDQYVEIHRQPLFSISIEGVHYISFSCPVDGRRNYAIYRYELIEHDGEGDQLRLFPLDPDVLARAILEKKLPGEATWYETPDKSDAQAQWVYTTASSKQLVAYIKKHEQELFDKSRPVLLRKWHPDIERFLRR